MNDTSYANDNFKAVKLLAVRKLINEFSAIQDIKKPSLTQLLNIAIQDYNTTHGLKSELEMLDDQ
ncbi:hypothetical protein [Pseudomonas sp.]|uniref:hypothetical protein n=1 Tax=Pseudomonas sp. TaxID=306 RepID=UPI004053EB9F